MTMDYAPASVWGARDATMTEVSGLEEHWVELTEEDLTRQRKKLSRHELQQGSYAVDGMKYAPKPQFAALYRADGSRHAVPLATYRRYLQKKDKWGNRIFYTHPPEEAPQLTSDPCPVRIGARTCGKRMLDQYELFLHIWRKHRDRAPYYLSQDQMKLAQGNVNIMEVRGLSTTPTTPPVDAPMDPSMRDLSTMMTEAINLKGDEEREKASARNREKPLATLESIETIPVPKRTPVATSKHSCQNRGRLGIYDESCPRCQELLTRAALENPLEGTEAIQETSETHETTIEE